MKTKFYILFFMLLLFQFSIGQVKNKATKSETIEYIQKELSNTVGIKTYQFVSGDWKEISRVKSHEFLFDKLIYEEFIPNNGGIIRTETYTDINWQSFKKIEIYPFGTTDSTEYKTNLCSFIIYFSSKVRFDVYCSDNTCSRDEDLMFMNHICIPVLKHKKDSFKRAILRLAEIAKKEQVLF